VPSNPDDFVEVTFVVLVNSRGQIHIKIFQLCGW
jgi:hypothetical protein